MKIMITKSNFSLITWINALIGLILFAWQQFDGEIPMKIQLMYFEPWTTSLQKQVPSATDKVLVFNNFLGDMSLPSSSILPHGFFFQASASSFFCLFQPGILGRPIFLMQMIQGLGT
jgi:hypothetical protein